MPDHDAPDSEDKYLEEDGMPPLEEDPPGRGLDLDEEGLMAPQDHSIAAGSDPAYAVTAAEERVRESVAARARREQPDVDQGGLPQDGEEPIAGRLFQPDSDVDEIDETAEEVALLAEDDGALSAEE